MEIRPLAAELPEHVGDQPGMHRALDIADGETADRAAGEVAAEFLHTPRIGEQRAGLGEESAALGIEMDALPCPFEQGDAQLRLELHDLPAERRLRNMQDFGGAADIAGLGDGDEISDLAQVEQFFSEAPSPDGS